MKFVTCAAALLVLFGFAFTELRGEAPGVASPAAEQVKARAGAGDIDGAIDAGEREVKVSSRDPLLWLALGEAYATKAQSASVLSQFGLARKCKSAFEKAISLDPKNVDAREDLFTYYVEAPGLAGGSIDLARKEAAEILKLDPARGHSAFASLSLHAKDLAAAEAEYRKSIEAAPRDIDARAGLGSVLLEEKRFGEAKQMWRGLVAEPEFEMSARYQLAKTCLLSGTDLEEGIEQLKKYLSAPPRKDQPSWSDAKWRLALLYEKLGEKPQAIAALKDALRLNPGHAQAKKDLKRLGG